MTRVERGARALVDKQMGWGTWESLEESDQEAARDEVRAVLEVTRPSECIESMRAAVSSWAAQSTSGSVDWGTVLRAAEDAAVAS